MPSWYNLTNMTTNVTGIDDLMIEVNTMTGQFYFSLIPPALFIILFVIGLRFGGKVSLLGASFITALLTMILYATSGVPALELYASLILLFVAFVLNYVVRE
jgi:hypothetical protein